MSNLKRWKGSIINEALALYNDYGDAALPVIIATAAWSKEHPIDGDDAATPAFFKKNYDYGSGQGLQGMLDDYRKKAGKKLKKRVHEMYAMDSVMDSAIPTEAYCGKEVNRRYWKQAGSGRAVRDFLKYIDQVSC